MKKFVWRLQRVLDIKIKEEESIRIKLAAIAEQAGAVNGLIKIKRRELNEQLQELGQSSGSEKFAKQHFFMRYAQAAEMKIKKLRSKLEQLNELKHQKTREILEIRKDRIGLEKLREKAKEQYLLAQQRYEQNELDDRVNVRYARQIQKCG